MENELQKKIEGISHQIEMLSDKRNTIIRVNRAAKTVLELFDDIMNKVALVIDNSASTTIQDEKVLNIAGSVPISFIVNGEEYRANSNTRLSRNASIEAARGSILDSSRKCISINRYGVFFRNV